MIFRGIVDCKIIVLRKEKLSPYHNTDILLLILSYGRVVFNAFKPFVFMLPYPSRNDILNISVCCEIYNGMDWTTKKDIGQSWIL